MIKVKEFVNYIIFLILWFYDDLYSGNRETAKETGIPFINDVGDDVAKDILAE